MFLGRAAGSRSRSRSIWSSSSWFVCLLLAAAAAALALEAKHEGIHAGMEEEEEEENDEEGGWEVMVRWSRFWARDSIVVGLRKIRES